MSATSASLRTITVATAIGAVGLDWHVAGFGDFNGDGATDMMLRNIGTGAFEAYDIQNGQLASAHSMGAVGLRPADRRFLDGIHSSGTIPDLAARTSDVEFCS